MTPQFLIIDLFCGAGGTTTGFAMAEINGQQTAKVIACINHDPKAIKSHWLNHPEVKHFEEDIRTVELSPLVDILHQNRLLYPNAKVILWASLECTNFSKAKGGQPRDADSRTLADHLDRYVTALNPDYIQIENVVEFMSWGPLDENGKPVSRKNGSEWLRWRKHINSFGYRDEWKEMNSADFGAYTSRNRLFGCFAKRGLPIVWPEPTHAKKPADGGLFGSLQKWKAVKDVLDFEDEGESIFTRKKPLSENTLERIYAGLIKYVAGGKKAFIAKYYSGRPAGKVIPVDGPAGTITTADGQSLVQPIFLQQIYATASNSPGNYDLNRPARTVTTRDATAIISASFLAKYYGNGDNISSVDEPAGTITTKDRFTKIQAVWLDKTYSGEHNHQSIDQPAGALLTNNKFQKVTCRPFIMDTNYNNVGSSIDEPKRALLASRRYSYIINPSHGGHSTSCDAPCPVIIARQDKSPLYLYTVIDGEYADVSLENFLNDEDYEFLKSLDIVSENPPSEMSIRLKIIHFMQLYGISDIKMRMLKVSELKVIQGFPADYHLFGNQSDQKKFIGNSVVPHVVKAWCEAMGRKLIIELKAA